MLSTTGLVGSLVVSGRFNASPREIQIIEGAIAGLGDKEIAEQIGISENTVGTYWRSVLSKGGVSSRRQLVGNLLSRALAEVKHDNEILTRTAGPMVVLDSDARVVLVTEAFSRLILSGKVAVQDLLGGSISDHLDYRFRSNRQLWSIVEADLLGNPTARDNSRIFWLTDDTIFDSRYRRLEGDRHLWILRDVTDRWRIEMDFVSAMESVAEATCCLDKEWRIVSLDRAFAEIFGLQPQCDKSEAESLWNLLLPPAIPKPLDRILHRAMRDRVRLSWRGTIGVEELLRTTLAIPTLEDGLLRIIVTPVNVKLNPGRSHIELRYGQVHGPTRPVEKRELRPEPN
jgi:DNA-binding CsgD family transcriptional regulator/PAS domain-containing protein